uniref:Obscurin-like protein 1 n=1 Tax=Erpetoichthys calabaricus TaxID=27687 RepID=A0A8C4SUB9_ERPCA
MDVFGGAPRFLAYPRPLVVPSGTDAVLKCQIAGDPRPTVIWERGNQQLQAEGRYRLFEDGNVYNLIISKADENDSGQYICKAKNIIGETYAAATLKVQGDAEVRELREENRPSFLIKPLSARVGRGEDAVFSCKLWGKPRPEVIWHKDGKKLNDIFESSHFSVSHQDGGWFQLKIFQTRAPDGGVYTCLARNEFGEALAGAVLLVDAGPGHEEDGVPKVKMFTVTEGKHAKFRCYVTGKPKPEIMWRKDGKIVISGRRHLLYEDREGYFTLKVLYCKQQDSGLYVCAASNTAGQTLSAVHLYVKEPARKFKQPLNDVEVREREQAVLECEVPDHSVPTTWYLEDRRLHPGAKYDIEQWGTVRRLTIRDIGADDDGIYLCEMADGERSIAEVSVRGTIVRKLPRKVDVLEGENAAFCVEVEEEEMDVHWYKDGNELRETHQTIIKSFGKTHFLVFVNASPQDSGLVTFIVGESKTSAHLRCPPSCPIGVQMNTERANAALMSWVPALDSRKNPPSGYVLERQEAGSHEWLQCLTTDSASAVEILGDSVPSEADYRFRICSFNKYGRSGHVEFPEFVHLVPVARIQTPLQDALVPAGTDAEFFIELSASVIGTWFLNGTQLQENEKCVIHHYRTQHFLLLKDVQMCDDRSEITFIAYGVRDSAVLCVQGMSPPMKFAALPEEDCKKVVQTGTPVVLSCEVSDAEAQVCWYKDGEEIHQDSNINMQSEGTVRRLIIDSAGASHSGVYRCDSTNDAVTPPVTVAPLSEVDLNKNLEAGSPLVLTCEVSDPSAVVHWYKDKQELRQEDFEIQSEGTTRRLLIPSTDFSHSGVYSCDAVDELYVEILYLFSFVVWSAVLESEPVVLYCELSRSDAPVHWYKDGAEIQAGEDITVQSEGTMRRLIIQAAKLSDSGVYACHAVDDTMIFKVNIREPPVTIIQPCDDVHLQYNVSDKIVLNCELSRANAAVHWYKNGHEILESEGVILESDGCLRKLTILNGKVEDSGEYVCDTNDDSKFYEVSVTEPAVQIVYPDKSPVDLRFTTSERVLLTCEVSRSNATVRWYRDGLEVERSENLILEEEGVYRRLILCCASAEDSGEYICDASDDSVTFNVIISEPPVKFLHPDKSSLLVKSFVGEPLELQCEVSRPNAVVCWLKDGMKIEEREGVCIEEDGTFRRLTIQSANFQDSGKYLCNAKDDVRKFKVKVTEAPVLILRKEELKTEQECLVSDDVVLECELSRIDGIVKWYKDGEKIVDNDRICLEEEGTFRSLVILNAEISDSGEYFCDAQDDSVVFHIKVKEPALKILNKEDAMEPIEVSENGSVTFCVQLSKDDASVQWLRNWREINDKRICSSSDGKSRKLTIRQAQLSDSGVYTCDASTDEIHFTLQVKELPLTFVRGLQHINAYKDDTITLRCELCKPKGDVQWLKDGQEILPSRRIVIKAEGRERSLTINRATGSDSGEYVCESKDDRTCAQLFSTFSVPRVVEFIAELHNVTVLEGEDATFKCMVSPEDAELVWHRNGNVVVPDERCMVSRNGLCHTLVIQNCQLIDSSKVTAEAEGVVSKANLQVQGKPAASVEGGHHLYRDLEAVIGEEHGEATLEVEVSLESGEVQWMRQGVVIQSSPKFTLNASGKKRSLTVHNLSISDRGTYRCETLHDRTQGKLMVERKKISILKGLTDTETFERETATFEVELSHVDVEGVWQKDGIRVKPHNNWRVSTNGKVHSLTLSNLTIEDSGTVAFSGENIKTSARLTVKELPVHFVKPLRDKTALEKHRVILECTVSNPRSCVRWYRGDNLILPSDHYEICSEGCYRKLVIHQVTSMDEGTYSVQAGEHQCSARLMVEGIEIGKLSIDRQQQQQQQHLFI